LKSIFKSFIVYSLFFYSIVFGCGTTINGDHTYSSSTTLSENVCIDGNLTQTGGTLNLNGFSLIVYGNLTQTAGTLDIDSGELIVKSNILQSGGELNINGGKLEVYKDYNITNNSNFIMTTTNSEVKLHSNFNMHSANNHFDFLTDGTIILDGNFSQKNYSGNYYSKNNHKTILNGDSYQTVSFEDPSIHSSHFNILDINNTSTEGVEFLSYSVVNKELKYIDTNIVNPEKLLLSGDTISSSYTIWPYSIEINSYSGNWTLKNDVNITSDLTISNNIYLNGYTLIVDGNLTQTAGTLDIDSGELIVKSNILQSGGELNINGGKLEVYKDYNITNNSNFIMTTTNSEVKLHSNFNMHSANNHFDFLTDGTIILDGNFSQKNYSGNYYSKNNHKTILNGDSYQTVSFEDPSIHSSHFNILDINNTSTEGVEFLTDSTINSDYYKCSESIITLNSNTLTINGTTYTKDCSNDIKLYINLSNLNLNEHNITNMQFIHDNGTSYINNDILNGNIQNGDFKFRIPVDYTGTNVTLKITLDDTNIWWYNFSDNKLYFDNFSNEFSYTLNGDYNISLDSTSTNFKKIELEDNNRLSFIELKIDENTYNNTTAKDINMSCFYHIDTREYDNNQVLKIGKILLSNETPYKLDIEVNASGSIINYYQNLSGFGIESNNTLVFKNGDTNRSAVKYIDELDQSELTNLYTSKVDNNISFPIDSKGYIFYEKYYQDECIVYDNFGDKSYTNTNDFVINHSYGKYNYLAVNEYNSSKVLMFDNENADKLVEVDIDTNTKSIIGTWSSSNSVSCKDEYSNNIDVKSLIKLDISIDGYNNRAYSLVGDKIKSSNFIKANDTRKIYLLNDISTKYLSSYKNLSTLPTIKKDLIAGWNYLSLPSNMTLCTSEYQSSLPQICNQNYTIESIFSNINIDTLLKYNGEWIYWSSTTKNYDMNKFGDISHKDGLLIKTTTSTSVNLPFDIYNLYPDGIKGVTDKGWYLLGSRFECDVSKVKEKVIDQSKKLHYVLQLNDNKWDIYAPLNDDQIDPDLKRINNMTPANAFWIYVE
jgi:formylmethanofuran dehydrogenase subunit C